MKFQAGSSKQSDEELTEKISIKEGTAYRFPKDTTYVRFAEDIGRVRCVKGPETDRE